MSLPSSQHHPLSSILSSTPSFRLILHALAPSPVYSSSHATSGCSRSYPPPLRPPTTWHLFRFIPTSWQTACISPRGHNAAIPGNQWQINQCYLFFPCLCCHRFFFLLLCCLWRLELCSIKLSSLSGTNCNSVRLSVQTQTLMLALDGGILELYLWDAPFKQKQQWVLLKLNLDLLVL